MLLRLDAGAVAEPCQSILLIDPTRGDQLAGRGRRANTRTTAASPSTAAAGTRTSAKSGSRSGSASSWTRCNFPSALPTRSQRACTPARRNSNKPAADRRYASCSASVRCRQRSTAGYDDYVEGRISDALWTRKSAQWETKLATVNGELSALDWPATTFVATGERIIELVKRAGTVYKTQDSAEQRRLLESVLSNCTFDRGSLCPT
jgi:hypothetical protein